MLLQDLRKNIDHKWDECWPISSLRPIAILDLIGFLYFTKKLDDREVVTNKLQSLQGGNFIYTKEIEDFSWSRLKNMDAQQVHEFFTKENGLLDLLKQYAFSNSLYSDYLKGALVLTPTPKLLSKAIEIINIIESSDGITQASIADYLFSKTLAGDQSSHAFIPDPIAELMVALADPSARDTICDPSGGNGSLIVNAAKHIADKTNSPVNKMGTGNQGSMKSMESDLIQLRLAAMNMMLHGINGPVAEILNAASTSDEKLPGNTSLFLSGLFVIEIEGNVTVEAGVEKSGPASEVTLLNTILNTMTPACRAVVMVPENLLNNISSDIKLSRQRLINNFNLEGIISLPSNNTLFSGAGILIFNKQLSHTTTDVWFHKMKSSKEIKRKEQVNSVSIGDFLPSADFYDISDILTQWHNHESFISNNTVDTLYITADDIRAHDYNLNFNDYKIIRMSQGLDKKPVANDQRKTALVATTKEHLEHFFEDTVASEKEKPKRKVFSAINLIFLMILTATGLYFMYGNHATSFRSASETTGSVANNLDDSAAGPVRGEVESTGNNIRKESSKTSAKNTRLNFSGNSKTYKVVNKAFFYNSPDINKRKSFFLQPGQSLVMDAANEKNGFVYVVYINKRGQSTRGWLNKNDLQPVK